MSIFSSRDNVCITDVQKIYLNALKQFPVMHLSPSEKMIDGDSGYIMAKQMNGKLLLKPNITKQGLLFRGDSKVNQPFISKQGRNIKQSGICYQQFESLINSFPLYKMLKHGVELPNGETLCLENPYGLAYIYDVSLPFIGLTSDLNVAMFYAVTTYNRESDKYEIVKDGTGVLYAYELRQPLRLVRSLSTLGLQIFPRSFHQKIFLLQMPDDADFNQHHSVVGFKFNHVKEIAQEIFDKFKGGELIAPTNDFLWNKLKRIKDSSTTAPVFEKNELENLYKRIDVYWAEFVSLIHFERNEEEIKYFLQELPRNDKYARYFNIKYYDER